MKKLLFLILLLVLSYHLLATNSFPLLNSEVYSVNNLDDLKSFIVEELGSNSTFFSVGYTGDTTEFTEDLELVFDEIAIEYPYDYYTLTNLHFDYNGYKNNIIIDFTIEYNTTVEQQYFVHTEVNKILSEIINPQMSSLEKIKAVNDYIVLNSEYSLDSIHSPYSPYTILKEGLGVCQAYALLGYKMLDELGFEVMYVIGEATDDHAWNLVKVDGEWYHLDMTWNDPQPDRVGNISYNYFLVNDEYLSKTHSWEIDNYPKSTSNRFTYFHSASSAVTHNSVIYYSNERDKDSLYRMHIDGSQNIKLNKHRSYYITLVDDWIYYSNYSDGGYLYKIGLNGLQNQRVNNSHTIDIYRLDSWLYYTLADSNIKEKVYIGK